jgi:hypothetical protein
MRPSRRLLFSTLLLGFLCAWPNGAKADSASILLTDVIAGPPFQFQITVQDATDGLAAITFLAIDNATAAVPSFTVGTTTPEVIDVTKLDQSKPFTGTIQVMDVLGDITTANFTDAGLTVATPEPGSLSMLSLGLAGLGFCGRRMRKRVALKLLPST